MNASNIESVIESFGKYTTKISFTHEYAYCWSVACYIDRYRDISVMGYGVTQDKSLSNALKLIDNLKKIQETNKVVVPDLSNQPNNNGHHHTMVGNTKIGYKRINNKFYLYSITTVTDDGFTILDTPVPIDNKYKFIEKTEHGDLYEWDDIQILSGTAGLAYVKDGLVVASKTIRIA